MEDFLILFISFIIIMGVVNIYKTKSSNVRYVKSNLYKDDNSEYLVRYDKGLPNDTDTEHNSQAGADAICFMRANLIELVAAVKKQRCSDGTTCTVDEEENVALKDIKPEEIEMLINRFNPDNISESTPSDKYTSYSVNKGEKIIFCIRDKSPGPGQFKIINVNTLMFVAIHELAHVMTKSIGHEPDFWNNMRYLLSVAINTKAKDNYTNNGGLLKKIKSDLNLTTDDYSHMIYNHVDYSKNGDAVKYCGTTITTTPCTNDKCT